MIIANTGLMLQEYGAFDLDTAKTNPVPRFKYHALPALGGGVSCAAQLGNQAILGVTPWTCDASNAANIAGNTVTVRIFIQTMSQINTALVSLVT